MPGPVFTTNDSEITRLEGLYIKERLPPAEIAGVSLNDVCVVSEAIRGPIGVAVECGSPARVREVFGGRDWGSGGTTTSPLWRALLNKPFSSVHVVRACAAAAATATKHFANVTPTDIIDITATSPGVWANDITIDIVDASDADANHFNLEVNYLGGTTIYKNLNTYTSADDNLLATIGDDYGNLVVVTKLANGRPLNVSAATLNGTAGAEGSIADSDFTASNKGLNVAANVQGVGIVWVAERMSDTLKAAIETLANAATDKIFLIGADAESTSLASAVTDVADYRGDRMVYAFNHCYTLDPETGAEILVRPESWMASILSQTDIDIHPGEEDTVKQTAGIIRLYNSSYTRADYITAKDAGICALESDVSGFKFVSGVTTSLTPGKEQITRRRMTDYIQLSLANSLKYFVKKKNTLTRRKVMAGLVDSFLDGLKKAERVVELYNVDGEILNTEVSRAQGIEKLFVRVKLIGHMLHLVLETEIGTNVKIEER
jgi:hypothetical protein